MILLQLSSGQGPIECCRAVALATSAVEKDGKSKGVAVNVVETVPATQNGCFKSVLLELSTNKSSDINSKNNTPKHPAKQLAIEWQGAMLWVCQSSFRPRHRRKNWFFSGYMYEVNTVEIDRGISFQSCRASGAGGQHVNTTDSAVRAIHNETGIAVRVESERSQHANKRLAKALLFQKLETLKQQNMTQQERLLWQKHWEIQRGDPIKTFSGEHFTLKQ